MKSVIWFLLFVFPLVVAAQTEAADQTLSPYFVVNGAAAGVEALPLKSTSATVNIAGVIADVVVTQTYTNSGRQPLEAVYVFPGSTNAAVYALRMQIGKRSVTARIEERNKARADYEAAKSEGKRASLLEQERPNVFKMNVANIMPGDTIQVELRYTELLIPENGTYEFVYPTVVGPRYTNGKSQNNDGFTSTPYTKQGKIPAYDFHLTLHIAAGMPVRDISSHTHKIKVADHGIAGADVLLDANETKDGNRDFILRYQLSGEETNAGVLLYSDGKEQFFICMAQPPKRPAADQIPPREYIFVLDVSGSMNGNPMDVAKKLLRNLVAGLRPTDQFNIILFAGTSNLLSDKSLKANTENVEKAVAFIDRQEGSGSTELLPALQRALKLPREGKALSRSVVVVTDGYIDVEAECFNLVRQHLNEANMFAFGIGSSVNRHLIEGLAHVGAGMPFVVTDEKQSDAVAEKFRKYIATPVFSNIQVSYPGFDAYDLEPTKVPDVFAQRPIIIMGKYRGTPQGEIVIDGFSGKKARSIRVPVFQSEADDRNAAIKYIWARERIKLLSDYDFNGQDPIRDAKVTQLGLQYNLLTAFTSFIAIDEVVANNGQLTTVKQPLPLPEGVSDLAIGFDLGIDGVSGLEGSSHGFWVGMAVLLLLLLGGVFIFRKRVSRFWIMIPVIVVTGLGSCTRPQEITYHQEDAVVFMLGEDRSLRNPYFTHAKSFFSTDSVEKTDLVITECRDLAAVHCFLANNRPIQGAWKKIYLVVHGNQWTGMRVPVRAGDPDRTSAEMIRKGIEQELFPALPAGHVAQETKMIVDGCNIGQDQALLDALSVAFSDVKVISSRYFTIFEANSGPTKCYLADTRYVVFPAGTYPGNRAVTAQLQHRYPNDQTDWNSALQRLAPRFPGDSYVHYFSIPVHWTTVYDNQESRPHPITPEAQLAWIKTQPELVAKIEGMGLTPDQFRWELQAVEYATGPLGTTQPAIAAEGLAMIYGIMQPLATGKGQDLALVRPDVEDERYYSMSSENSH